jgi:hypothetical protein
LAIHSSKHPSIHPSFQPYVFEDNNYLFLNVWPLVSWKT